MQQQLVGSLIHNQWKLTTRLKDLLASSVLTGIFPESQFNDCVTLLVFVLLLETC